MCDAQDRLDLSIPCVQLHLLRMVSPRRWSEAHRLRRGTWLESLDFCVETASGLIGFRLMAVDGSSGHDRYAPRLQIEEDLERHEGCTGLKFITAQLQLRASADEMSNRNLANESK